MRDDVLLNAESLTVPKMFDMLVIDRELLARIQVLELATRAAWRTGKRMNMRSGKLSRRMTELSIWMTVLG